MKRIIATCLLVVAVLLAACTAGSATPVTRHKTATTVPPKTRTASVTTGDAVTISGLDLHDGTIYQSGGLYYFVGTQYGCGFQWGINTTHFCGFAASSAPALTGPWSAPVQLFSPTSVDSWSGLTWDQDCSTSVGGAGCFNPRMIQRGDGVWILWFNAPGDYSQHGANAYNTMGCEGPSGPCGPGSGPHGSFHKPSSYTCARANGDFSVVLDGSVGYLECTGADQHVYIEQLDTWWTNGTGNVSGHGVGPLLSGVEGPGAYKDARTGTWISTYSEPEVGYGTGATGYMTAPTMLGPWSRPPNGAQGGTTPEGRALISTSSCGGQPRTVVTLDGQPYQLIDIWLGTRNETGASTHLEPLNYQWSGQVMGDGQLWQPFTPWSCA